MNDSRTIVSIRDEVFSNSTELFQLSNIAVTHAGNIGDNESHPAQTVPRLDIDDTFQFHTQCVQIHTNYDTMFELP